MKAHGLVKMDETFVVVEYCGSFKLVRSEGMRCIGKRNVITIANFITITEDGRGVSNARSVPQYTEVNGLLRDWELIEDLCEIFYFLTIIAYNILSTDCTIYV